MQQFYQKKNKNGCIYMYRSTANQKEYCSTKEIKKKYAMKNAEYSLDKNNTVRE